MKLLFLSVIVIVNVVCFGQKKDTTILWQLQGVLGGTSATNIGASLWATPANHPNDFVITPKQDTIACLMLVCDTLKRSNGVLWLDSTGKVMDEVLSTTPEVWWKPGFMVKSEKLIKDKWSGCDGCTYEYTAIITSYLDRRKKPLDSWIVVWMTKEVK